MWPNSQEIADLVTFTEEILYENFIYCAVSHFVITVAVCNNTVAFCNKTPDAFCNKPFCRIL